MTMRKLGLWLARGLLLVGVLISSWIGGGLAMSKASNSDEAIRGWIITAVVVVVAVVGVRLMYGGEQRSASMKQFLGAVLLVWLASSIMTPVFQGARAARPATACNSNIKRLATATQVYIADTNDVLPLAESWYESLQPYAKRDFHCPDAKSKYSYGMNTALGGVHTRDITSPDKTVLFFEMDSDQPNAHGTAKDAVPRHRGWFAIALADGSATTSSATQPKWIP